MKILMLSWEYPPRIVGGISRVVHDLAQKIGERGEEIHVVTCREQNTVEEELDRNVYVHRVSTYEINTMNFVDWVMQLNFALLERSISLEREIGGYDIIHAHDWIVAYAARVLKHSLSIPLVSTIHATEHGRNCGIHTDTQKYISSIEWWLAYESWKVIVNSQYMKNEVRNIFQVPEDKLCVIPNGVNPEKFAGCVRDYSFRRRFAMDNEKIILFVGRLVNEKGVQVLVDAIPKILKYYYDVKFIIVGRGPQSDYLKYKVASAYISQKVYFTGYIPDEELNKLYKCADMAVFPSLYEPFGIVALEGSAAGLPIVVSDTGGLGEIVEHGVDGMKSYTGNANSLADSILEILYKPELAEEMKKRAFDKILKIFNWDKISGETIEVYNKVLAKSVSDL